MQREVQYFPPNACWHPGWLIHKSYKVILLKSTMASGKEEAPMVYLEAVPHGRRSNDYSLYYIGNSVETPRTEIALRAITLPSRSLSNPKTFQIYENQTHSNMTFNATA